MVLSKTLSRRDWIGWAEWQRAGRIPLRSLSATIFFFLDFLCFALFCSDYDEVGNVLEAEKEDGHGLNS